MKIHILFFRDTSSAIGLVVQQSAVFGCVSVPDAMASTCYLLFCLLFYWSPTNDSIYKNFNPLLQGACHIVVYGCVEKRCLDVLALRNAD